jgi:hypothetical protein
MSEDGSIANEVAEESRLASPHQQRACVWSDPRRREHLNEQCLGPGRAVEEEGVGREPVEIAAATMPPTICARPITMSC